MTPALGLVVALALLAPGPGGRTCAETAGQEYRSWAERSWYLAECTASSSDPLTRIRLCESGGNYTVIDPTGTYFGAYQFDLPTWQSVGGAGYPHQASPAEQDYRASVLFAERGAAPWPVCGRL